MAKRKTHAEFIAEINEKYSGNITVLGEYKNSLIKLEIKCNICDGVQESIPKYLIKGHGCKSCSKRSMSDRFKKTVDQARSQVAEVGNGEYKLIEYTGYHDAMKLEHNCGCEYTVTAFRFFNGKGKCPDCSNLIKGRTPEEFRRIVLETVGDEYVVHGEYTNNHTHIEMEHTKCGHRWNVNPNSFISKESRCPSCGGSLKKEHAQFVTEVGLVVGNEYTVIGTYRSSKETVEIKHNLCGQTWFPQANNFLRGSRCDHCYGKHTKTTELFKKEVFEAVGDEYTVLGEYERSNGNVKMIHNECGYEWNPRPSDFLNRQSRCPACKQKGDSKGVKRIMKFLEDGLIKYTVEHRFSDCRNVKPLPFDFKVDFMGITTMVEYDGEQHFKGNSSWGGEKALRETQLRDQIKNDYCVKNNINLVRIPYWEYDNIETILEEALGLVTV